MDCWTSFSLPTTSSSESLEDKVLVELQSNLVPEVNQGGCEQLFHALEDQARDNPEAPMQVNEKASTYFFPVRSLSGLVCTFL